MSDSLSNVSHIVICADDISPEVLKPLLLARNDALDYLFVVEEIIKGSSLNREDYKKLKESFESFKKSLLGEYNQFGDKVRHPVPLQQMPNIKEAFETLINSLSYRTRDYIYARVNLRQDNRQERLEKSLKFYHENKPYLKPLYTPKVGPDKRPEPENVPEQKIPTEEKHIPATDWPKIVDSPGIKRIQPESIEYWHKIEPIISEIINLPTGKERGTIGEAAVDSILRYLDSQPSLEEFIEKSLRMLPPYYRVADLEESISRVNEDLASAQSAIHIERLQKQLRNLEERQNNVNILLADLRLLHKNWIPEMKNKSALIKDINHYRLILGDRSLTLEVSGISASIKFASVSDACKKFIEISTPQEVEMTFDVNTLLTLEKQANHMQRRRFEDPEVKKLYLEDRRNDLCEHLQDQPLEKQLVLLYGMSGEYDSFGPVAQFLMCHPCWEKNGLQKEAAGIESLVKPNQKGPSAEEEKPMVTAIVEWLNASNAQGTEEDIEKMVSTYLNAKAPDYHDENVARVARKAYAEWKASQPIPSEVGREGKPNVGVANDQGSGVFVEPNRGNSGVQNEAPMAAVRKEASTEEIEVCSQCDMGAHERCSRGSCKCGCQQESKSNKRAELLIVAIITKKEDGWYVMSEKGKHLGGPYKSRTAAKKRLQQVEMFKHMKGATQGESIMIFNVGDVALLNTKVGALEEGTEVVVTSCSEEEVSFTAGDILGITKVANLDSVSILKEAGSDMEKYPWDNDGLKFKYNLGDRVRAGSCEHDGMNLKGKEGVIRDKVIMSAETGAEQFYLVEFDTDGTATLPEEALSKAGKMPKREAALNHDEFVKEAVLKPNFEVTQDFLNSYDHPPTVVTTADIEAWLSDPKNNYQYSKKDLKEIIKYLQSAKVEVRVPAKKEAPEILPDEEMAEVEAVKKEAKKYKMEQTKPDGSKVTVEKEITQDMGPGFETEDPAAPGVKNKWVAASVSCTKCAGVGSLPCGCMDSPLWLSNSCSKCNDEGSTPCPSCKK